MSYKTFTTSAGPIAIRSFRDADEGAAKRLFVAGQLEQVGDMYRDNLRNTSFFIVSLSVLLVVTCISQSTLVILSTVVVLLFLPYPLSCFFMNKYVTGRLKGDLRDIRAYYTEKSRNHMWVAECGGNVIGTVAVREDTKDNTKAELMTLSVAKDYRRLGIADTLTNIAIDFSTSNGYTELYLETGRWMSSANAFFQRQHFKSTEAPCYFTIIYFKIILCKYSMSLKEHKVKKKGIVHQTT